MNPKLPRTTRFSLLALLAGLFSGCVTVVEQISWDDLTAASSSDFQPSAEMIKKRDRAPTMSPTLRRQSELAKLAVSRSLDGPVLYEKGVLGMVGNAKMFVALRQDIPDFNRLYWVMVKVLSRKYGCFMTKRVKTKEAIAIKCRDKRNIVLWRSRGKDWIQFYARQFDRDGYEITVRKRRKIRVSKRPVLSRLL